MFSSLLLTNSQPDYQTLFIRLVQQLNFQSVLDIGFYSNVFEESTLNLLKEKVIVSLKTDKTNVNSLYESRVI